MKKKFFFFLLFFFFIFSFFLFFKPKPKLNFVEVKRGEIREEISEIGVIKKSDPINLSFEVGGKIGKIFVKEGDEIKQGTLLAKLEDKEAQELLEKQKIFLESAQRTYEKMRLQYEFLKRGDEKKEILEEGLQMIKNPLDKFLFVLDEIEDLLFAEELERGKSNIQYYSEYNPKFKDYPERIKKKITSLKITYEKIKNLREKDREEAKEENLLSLSYLLFSEILEICQLAKEPILNLKETILTLNLNHEKENLIENHFLLFSKLESDFGELKNNLLKILTALETWYDKLKLMEMELVVQELQIKEREKLFFEAKRNLEKHDLFSPVNGKILKINFKEGEMVNPSLQNFAFQIIPESSFEIIVDIYEKEIPKVKKGNLVEISFPAFEGEIFLGKVESVSKEPKIKEGVVYYEVKILPESLPQNIFSGMTCDLKIIVNKKENILTLPLETLKKKDGKYFVEVLDREKIIEKEIEVGILDDENFEIISGLSEGEKVLIP